MMCDTILHALAKHCTTKPEHRVLTWVDQNCQETDRFTYQELDEDANAVAAMLLEKGCQKGDRVMIAYPFGLEFLAGLFGSMKIGVIPCSIYPPNPSPSTAKSDMAKFRCFAEDAGAKYALSTCAFSTLMKTISVVYKSKVKWIGTDKLRKPSASKLQMIQESSAGATGQDIAFIQYTSGSTGHPKGVVISHKSLVKNTSALVEMGVGKDPSSTTALWLPQYHDMGLIGGFMTTIYSGSSLVMASPLHFMSQPLLWVDMIEKYKANITSAPNFAYALLVKRLKQAGKRADWSHLTRVFFGAEPTQHQVVRDVIEFLGAKPQCVYNAYGLAETVVYVTTGVATSAEDGIVACGPAEGPEMKLRIVNQEAAVPDGQVGAIWVQSPRCASGYYNREELTASTFQNTLPGEQGIWLDTGDLGKVVDGILYVTGREKEVIIVGGKNYWPYDVERSVEAAFCEAVKPGRSAAFQFSDDTIGIVVEARNAKLVKETNIHVGIWRHIAQEHGLSAEKVLVMVPNSIPKTTSGKIKRGCIRQRTINQSWDKERILLQHDSASSDKTSNTHPNSVGLQQSPDHCKSKPTLLLLLEEALGAPPDVDMTWAENGLTSVKAAELLSQINEAFGACLPPNYTEMYQTPRELIGILLSTQAAQFEVMEHEDGTAAATMSEPMLATLQAVGVVALILLFALSLLPSFFIGRATSQLSLTVELGDTGRAVLNFLPIVVPTFIATFTGVVIILKWLIIGRYKAQTMQVSSWSYLRWWFMDRLMEMWEMLAGQFMLETKLLWLVYTALGAKISPSSKVDAFIREFDLVHIGPNSKLSHKLRCRKFRSWTNDQVSPIMVLRPSTVGKETNISGMLGPGCKVGDGCRVEKLSSVEEGSLVPDGAIARGSPAFNMAIEETEGRTELMQWNWQLDVLKILWMFINLYLFFGLLVVAQIVVNQQLPAHWRYTNLLYWFLLLGLTAVLGVVLSVLLKWSLIGRRSFNRDIPEGTLALIANWACDYHFRLCQFTLLPFSGASKIWVPILKLHGLDVDYTSSINGFECFAPSNVDLIKIQRSFISVPSFDIDASKGKIEIIDSTLGYNVCIHSGSSIVRSSVPPKTAVRESMCDSNQKQPVSLQPLAALAGELAQLLLSCAIFGAFIPAFEVFLATVYNTSLGVAILGIGAALVAQILSLHLLLRLVEPITLHYSPTFLQRAMFGVYINHAWLNKMWNFWYLLHGTPFMTLWLRLMGAEVDPEGGLLYMGCAIHDITKLHFRGKVIVDDSHIAGHFVVQDELTIEDTYLQDCLLHPYDYAYAGARVYRGEYGPYAVLHAMAKMSQQSEESTAVLDTAMFDLNA